MIDNSEMILSSVMTTEKRPFSLEYIGDREMDFTASLGFKRAVGSGSRAIKLFVYRDGEIAAVKETEMTEDERFVNIPFKACAGANIELGVMNCDDTTNIVFTLRSIGVRA